MTMYTIGEHLSSSGNQMPGYHFTSPALLPAETAGFFVPAQRQEELYEGLHGTLGNNIAIGSVALRPPELPRIVERDTTPLDAYLKDQSVPLQQRLNLYCSNLAYPEAASDQALAKKFCMVAKRSVRLEDLKDCREAFEQNLQFQPIAGTYAWEVVPHGMSRSVLDWQQSVVSKLIQGFLSESVHVPVTAEDFWHAAKELGFEVPPRMRKSFMTYVGNNPYLIRDTATNTFMVTPTPRMPAAPSHRLHLVSAQEELRWKMYEAGILKGTKSKRVWDKVGPEAARLKRQQRQGRRKNR